jgi:hypothetical protein
MGGFGVPVLESSCTTSKESAESIGNTDRGGVAVSVRLVVNVPVWGERYVDRWLRWSLPSLMAEGNLPTVARWVEVVVQVVTSPVDAERFGSEELVNELRRLVRTEIVEVDGLQGGYMGMSRGNLVSLRAAAAERAGFCFGWADVIWPDGIRWGSGSYVVAPCGVGLGLCAGGSGCCTRTGRRKKRFAASRKWAGDGEIGTRSSTRHPARQRSWR